jgi:hypothetical protein
VVVSSQWGGMSEVVARGVELWGLSSIVKGHALGCEWRTAVGRSTAVVLWSAAVVVEQRYAPAGGVHAVGIVVKCRCH